MISHIAEKVKFGKIYFNKRHGFTNFSAVFSYNIKAPLFAPYICRYLYILNKIIDILICNQLNILDSFHKYQHFQKNSIDF